MSRSLAEWVGRSDDTRAPPKVRQRIFDRDGSCHLCSQTIQPGQKWDLDHVKALINGGENREANLRPAHRKCHIGKTAQDVAEKAKIAAIRQKHIGIERPKQKIPSAPFPKTSKPDRVPDALQPLPKRQLFRASTPASLPTRDR